MVMCEMSTASHASCAAAYHAAVPAPSITLRLGDCMEVMKSLPDCSIDSCVTDPPYGLNFMGKEFDNPKAMTDESGSDMEKFQKYLMPIFKEILRVAKPGAHLLAFGGTRTFHRLACAIEDAGWEIRDCIMWVYGSGFPKSMDVSKAIDKAMGAERTEVIGTRHRNVKPYDDGNGWNQNNTTGDYRYTAPATPEAAAWNGYGTCLKPACETIVVARKPLEGTVAANVIKYGTGAINIDGCRVPYESDADKDSARPQGAATAKPGALAGRVQNNALRKIFVPTEAQGRFPANLIHDGSDEVLELFPDTGKSGVAVRHNSGGSTFGGNIKKPPMHDMSYSDSGSAARFFYCAKASRKERGEGNTHPTVKPLALMRYLVRLVTRKGGLVLDPFMGSGTTGVACAVEGMRFFGCEKEPAYFEIAKRRVDGASGEVECESESEKTDVPVQSHSPQAETSNTTARQMEFEL